MSKRELIDLARSMRRNPTPSEDMFWQAVRGHRLDGVKFRRQQVIEHFIVDFFAPAHRLVVEIDGGVHQEQADYDVVREEFLENCGLRVLRFTDTEVETALDKVLDEVREVLKTTPPAPLPQAKRGVTRVRLDKLWRDLGF